MFFGHPASTFAVSYVSDLRTSAVSALPDPQLPPEDPKLAWLVHAFPTFNPSPSRVLTTFDDDDRSALEHDQDAHGESELASTENEGRQASAQ